LYDLASSALAQYGASQEVAHRLVFDLADLVDAGPRLARLASELSQRLADSNTVEGRVQLLSLLTAMRSWLQLEVCKHAEGFAQVSEGGIEESLWQRLIADGMSEEELSKRLLSLSEGQSGDRDK